MYPGIPEYFNDRGRGAYTYLTGSASWYLLTLLTEAFGVKGQLGDLVLEPKLMADQFDADGKAAVRTLFAGRRLTVTFENPRRLDYGSYGIERVTIDGQDISLEGPSAHVTIGCEAITACEGPIEIVVTVT
jgi:cellobiose phosphorylase